MNYELGKKSVLFIDTSSSDEALVALQYGEKTYNKTKKYDRNKAQIVLPLIQELLFKHGLEFGNINAIEVSVGPGSFTGLRVGVAIANALGYTLAIPINSLPPGQLVEPTYT